jgi:ABC-type nitrate/sulfonate/bicarbonate transport system substrate-binding protein
VTSTRAFVKADGKTVTAFLNAYVSAIQTIKKDTKLAERVLIKWLKEKESANLTKSVEAFARLFKPVPYVPDKGIENVLRDLVNQRPVPKDLIGHPELFRDNGPLERSLVKQ